MTIKLFVQAITKFLLGSETKKIVRNQLEGYKEYKQKVKYRLIPFIW